MGGTVNNFIEDPIGTTVDTIDNTVEAVHDTVENTIEATNDFIDNTAEAVHDTVDAVGEFTYNVAEGVVQDYADMYHGIVEGDWVKFRDAFISQVQTTAYMVAFAIGVMTSNTWLVAAAVVALDGQYNQGQLTYEAVSATGKFEKDVFGTENINENIDVIVASIIIAGSIYAFSTGFGILADATGLSAILGNPYVSTAMGVNSIYEAYNAYQEAKELYDRLMAEYLAWLAELNSKTKAFNITWDMVYGNSELLYEASAGGYLFNAGAGSEQYSVSTIHEQCSYLLALDNKKDEEFEMYYTNPNEIDYVKLNIDDITPQIIREGD